jgi:hypothetical protein
MDARARRVFLGLCDLSRNRRELLMRVFVVVNHVCEADIVVAVFSDEEKAREFKKQNSNSANYEDLQIEEFEVDKQP